VPIRILRARSAAAYLFLWETAGSLDLSGGHFLAAKKPAVAARKIGAKGLAFGLPQDFRIELMFGSCAVRASLLKCLGPLEFLEARRRVAAKDRRGHRS
jgi:hypothetical protein